MRRRTLCLSLALPLTGLTGGVAAKGAGGPLRVAWVSIEQSGSASPVFGAFRDGLAALGYVEGKNLVIDTWWGDGSAVRLEQLRPDILRAGPEVIVANGGIALGPMRHASVTVPVLFSMSADPVLAGVVASYARPGGNLTGITLFASDLIGKRMAMLKQLLPNLHSVAVLANPAHPGAQRELQASREAAARLKLELRFQPASSPAAVDAALAEIAAARVDAVLILSDGFALAQAERIAEFSRRQRIPTMAGWATFAQRGNLMAYGPEFEDVFRRLASYADRIHKGAKPGDLPVEQPTKFQLVINLRTARALGLTVPRDLLLQATEVID